MKDPLSDLVGYALRRASSAMMEDMAKRMGALGLRTSEASVLMLIRANPGITQSDLCRALGIQRANMAPLIARMEARKLVARSRSDGRSFGLAVTEAGEELAASARRVSDEQDSGLLAVVPPEHRAHLLPALSALWRADQSSSGQ
jgi:DNA-binding MarR family transcriptional regulator